MRTGRRVPGEYGKPGDNGPHIWLVELTADLEAFGNATATLLRFTGATYALTVPAQNIRVYDYSGVSGNDGDKLHVIYHIDSRRWLTLAGGGMICTRIRFEILSIDIATTPPNADVQIDSRRCGCATVPEEDEYGQVTVWFPLHCTQDIAVGMTGFAEYMQPDGWDYCRWEVDSLCCPMEA